MVKDIVHDKWIEVWITMSSASAHLIKSKKQMKEYADELDWILEVDKEGYVSESGARMYEIKIRPEHKMISPEDYRKISDKLLGFSLDLLADLQDTDIGEINGTFSPVIIKFLEAKKPEDVEFGLSINDTLMLKYKLVDRFSLEKKDLNLAKVVFFETINEMLARFKLGTSFFNNFRQNEETIKQKDQLKQRLKDWFHINVGK